MMSNHPKVYGHCDAGCKRRVPFYDEFAESAAYIRQPITDGTATVEPIASYKIESTQHGESLETITIPNNFIANAKTAAVGKKIYLFGDTAIQCYDTETNTLIDCVATIPANKGKTAAAVGTNIYLFVAIDEYEQSANVYKYDTTTDTISELGTIAHGVVGASAVAIGNNVYIVGSQINTSVSSYDLHDTISEYNTVTGECNSWNSTIATAYNGVVAIGHNIYVFGGIGSGTQGTNKIYCIDTIKKMTEQMSGVLPYSMSFIAAVNIGTKAYLFGGRDSNTTYYKDTICVYDTETDTLTTSEKNTRGDGSL